MVKEEHDKLEQTIESICGATSDLLAKHRADFLSAYECQMLTVKNDFACLQKEIEKKERSIANNERLKQTEQERDCYKREALHLDSMIDKAKKREMKLVEKIVDLEQDRQWLRSKLRLRAKKSTGSNGIKGGEDSGKAKGGRAKFAPSSA